MGGVAQANTFSCVAINDDSTEDGTSTYAGAVWLNRVAATGAITCNSSTASGHPATVNLRNRNTYESYHTNGFTGGFSSVDPVQITNNVLAHAHDAGTSLAQGIYVTFASGATNISVTGSQDPLTGGAFSRYLPWNQATDGSADVKFDLIGKQYSFTITKPAGSTTVNAATINNKTIHTITIDSISVDDGTAGDFITTDNDGLTINATLSHVLGAGDKLEYSTDGSTWTDITSSLAGTTITHIDSALTSTATIQMRVTDSETPTANSSTPASQLITINPATPAGITVTAISGNTAENGQQATFTVVLNSQPTADVTIDLSSDDPTEGTVSPASIKFTTSDWNTPQTVTATGVDDSEVDGDKVYNIVTALAASTDANYNVIDANDVAVTNTDLGSDVPVNANDTDPVSDTDEQGPTGTDTTYDGNGDGQPDKAQSDVVSMPVNSGANYATFVLEQNYNDLTKVADIPNPSPSDSPSGLFFPMGILDIDLPAGAGGAAKVVIHVPSDITWPTSYWKYTPTTANPTAHWYEFLYDGTTGAVFDEPTRTITVHFKDGQRGDEDLAANGQIDDQGGPVAPIPPVAPAAGTGVQNIPVFGPFGLLAMFFGLLWFGNRRRKS